MPRLLDQTKVQAYQTSMVGNQSQLNRSRYDIENVNTITEAAIGIQAQQAINKCFGSGH